MLQARFHEAERHMSEYLQDREVEGDMAVHATRLLRMASLASLHPAAFCLNDGWEAMEQHWSKRDSGEISCDDGASVRRCRSSSPARKRPARAQAQPLYGRPPRGHTMFTRRPAGQSTPKFVDTTLPASPVHSSPTARRRSFEFARIDTMFREFSVASEAASIADDILLSADRTLTTLSSSEFGCCTTTTLSSLEKGLAAALGDSETTASTSTSTSTSTKKCAPGAATSTGASSSMGPSVSPLSVSPNNRLPVVPPSPPSMAADGSGHLWPPSPFFAAMPRDRTPSVSPSPRASPKGQAIPHARFWPTEGAESEAGRPPPAFPTTLLADSLSPPQFTRTSPSSSPSVFSNPSVPEADRLSTPALEGYPDPWDRWPQPDFAPSPPRSVSPSPSPVRRGASPLPPTLARTGGALGAGACAAAGPSPGPVDIRGDAAQDWGGVASDEGFDGLLQRAFHGLTLDPFPDSPTPVQRPRKQLGWKRNRSQSPSRTYQSPAFYRVLTSPTACLDRAPLEPLRRLGSPAFRDAPSPLPRAAQQLRCQSGGEDPALSPSKAPAAGQDPGAWPEVARDAGLVEGPKGPELRSAGRALPGASPAGSFQRALSSPIQRCVGGSFSSSCYRRASSSPASSLRSAVNSSPRLAGSVSPHLDGPGGRPDSRVLVPARSSGYLDVDLSNCGLPTAQTWSGASPCDPVQLSVRCWTLPQSKRPPVHSGKRPLVSPKRPTVLGPGPGRSQRLQASAKSEFRCITEWKQRLPTVDPPSPPNWEHPPLSDAPTQHRPLESPPVLPGGPSPSSSRTLSSPIQRCVGGWFSPASPRKRSSSSPPCGSSAGSSPNIPPVPGIHSQVGRSSCGPTITTWSEVARASPPEAGASHGGARPWEPFDVLQQIKSPTGPRGVVARGRPRDERPIPTSGADGVSRWTQDHRPDKPQARPRPSPSPSPAPSPARAARGGAASPPAARCAGVRDGSASPGARRSASPASPCQRWSSSPIQRCVGGWSPSPSPKRPSSSPSPRGSPRHGTAFAHSWPPPHTDSPPPGPIDTPVGVRSEAEEGPAARPDDREDKACDATGPAPPMGAASPRGTPRPTSPLVVLAGPATSGPPAQGVPRALAPVHQPRQTSVGSGELRFSQHGSGSGGIFRRRRLSHPGNPFSEGPEEAPGAAEGACAPPDSGDLHSLPPVQPPAEPPTPGRSNRGWSPDHRKRPRSQSPARSPRPAAPEGQVRFMSLSPPRRGRRGALHPHALPPPCQSSLRAYHRELGRWASMTGPRELSAESSSGGSAGAADRHPSEVPLRWQSFWFNRPHSEHAISFETSTRRNARKRWFCSQTLLGTGGFGAVYLGMSHEGMLVAVKQMETGRNSNAALLNEVKMLSRLRHNHIIAYLGSTVVDSKVMVIMEYACTTLAKVLVNFGKLSLSSAKRYTRDVTRGLRYLHFNAVLHRDIKPQNVLIGQTGTCKLADFGMALQHDKVVQDGISIEGTPHYMAPETVHGQIGMAADVWALGVTTWEMLYGKLEGNQSELAILYQLGLMKRAPQIPDDLSNEVKDFLKQSLCLDPNHRATAQQLLDSTFLL